MFAFESGKHLFMTLDHVIVSLAYTVEDERKIKPILKNLRKREKLASSAKILDGIGKNIKRKTYFSMLVSKVMSTIGIGPNISELSKGLY